MKPFTIQATIGVSLLVDFEPETPIDGFDEAQFWKLWLVESFPTRELELVAGKATVLEMNADGESAAGRIGFGWSNVEAIQERGKKLDHDEILRKAFEEEVEQWKL